MTSKSRTKAHLLIYDGDCAFCELWVNRLREWLPFFPEAKASNDIEIDSLGLSTRDVQKYVWYVTPSHHYGGYLATSALLRAQPKFTLRLLGTLLTLWPISWLAAGVYGLIARFRHKLPGGSPACDPGAVPS